MTREKKQILVCHTHYIWDRKPHFWHAVRQQISQAERGGSCLVIRQIDISIFVAFVFYNRLFQGQTHIQRFSAKINSPLMQSVAFCCECVMAFVRSAAMPPCSSCQTTCSHSLPHNSFSVMIVVFCSALTHKAVSQWELMCAAL